ncbi:MAG: hypothetical protein Ta2B_06790 [Termitinemataceae bacterium]|nr:MAG: hypothetical protein Ta2B_06790 [Termitinemataceae bacterium]
MKKNLSKIFTKNFFLFALVVFLASCVEEKPNDGDICYTVLANGALDTTTSRRITFSFESDVDELLAEDIKIQNGSGSVVAGELTGSGSNYSLSVSNVTQGDITISIERDGIEAEKKIAAVYKSGGTIEDCPKFDMVKVIAGNFKRDAVEANVSVISNDFYIGKTEVTQELFEYIMGTNPSRFNGNTKQPDPGEVQEKRPVEYVSWYDAITFCCKLSIEEEKTPVYTIEGVDWDSLSYRDVPKATNENWNAVTMDITANGYRLPTEMEWMWAAMGGSTADNSIGWQKEYSGAPNGDIGSHVWYETTKTHQVGKKTGNQLLIYDMSGNVAEWCFDWFGDYPTGIITDYTGTDTGSSRVLRGGSWSSGAGLCKIKSRDNGSYSTRTYMNGIRIVCTVSE